MKLLLLAAIALVGSAPVLAGTPRPTNEAPKEKKVCKRTAETGSFVKGKKVCLTRREWNAVADKGQETGRNMQSLISTERGQ